MRRDLRHQAFVVGALVVTLFVGATSIAVVVAALAPTGRLLVAESTTFELPHPKLRPLAQRSVVYDISGRQMAVLYADENRAPVPMRSIAPVLQQAVLAAEDRNFYEHGGVDWRGIVRAVGRNLDAGSVLQGGSSITQQLVKNTMFDDPKRDLHRKVQEAVLATALEKEYSKTQIFQRYLNTIYFGAGAYGVRAATERYFGREPSRVTLAQAALLAALIANPEGRNPINHPSVAARWRSHVLDEMVRAKSVPPDEAALARATPLPRVVHVASTTPSEDPYVEEVKRRLLNDRRLGETRAERYHLLFEGGLRIYTPFDPSLQAAAETAVRNSVPPGLYTAALVAIDNHDGSVKAMVPGAQYQRAGFNLATQGRRQTGSAFKAVTVTTAMANGFSPFDRVFAGSHCTFDMGKYAKPWNVSNFDGESFGTLTLTKALALSSNCAFARVALAVGPEKIAEMGRQLGIVHPLQAVPSITLGTNAVSPLDMATVVSTLASDGVRHNPRFVTKVVNRHGDVLIDDVAPGRQVIDPQVARTATEMLTHVVTEGTGRRAQIGRPIFGKTGTNQAFRDAWFIGATPQLSAAVWLGNPDRQIPVIINGSHVVGGLYPAQIWHDFMEVAVGNLPVVPLSEPDERLWPSPGFITERGRTTTPPPEFRPPPPPPPPTTAPPAVDTPPQKPRPKSERAREKPAKNDEPTKPSKDPPTGKRD